MNTAFRASAYDVTAATLWGVGSSGMIVALWRIRSMICGGGTRRSGERAGDGQGSGPNLKRSRSCDPPPKLLRKDGLKKRPAQADPEHLTGRPEEIRDTRRDSNVLLGHVRNHGLCDQTSGKKTKPDSNHRRARRLTIKVEVIILAIPKPWGIKSNHRWNSDVPKFHKETDTLAMMASDTDTNVKEYNLPVLRISLCKRLLDTNQ